MNRSRTIRRGFAGEGSERSQQLGLALAQHCDPELLEGLLHHIAAVQEFGGEFYVGAARDRFDEQGRQVERGGSFETYAYVVGYNERSRVKLLSAGDETAVAQEPEPDEPYEAAVVPPIEEPEPEPEPVGANNG